MTDATGRGAMGKTQGEGDRSGFDMIWTRPLREPRAPRQPLSREQIVAAAVELADQRGMDGVSTRAIAGRLGASPTAMYWHVPSKDDLYELMFDAAMSELELPGHPSGDWRSDLRMLAELMHGLHRRHRWLVLLGIQPGIGPAARRYGEFGVAVLAPLRLARNQAVSVLAMVNNYVYGFAHRQAAWEQLRHRAGFTEADWSTRLDRYLADARRKDPDLADDISARMRLASEESFEEGLNCLIMGIAATFGQADQPQTETS